MNSSHRYVKHCTRLYLFVGYHIAQFIPKTNFHSNAMFFKMRWPTELQGFSHKLAAVLEGAKNKPYINTKHLHRSTFCFHKTCFRNRCLTNTLLTEMLNICLPNFGYGVILGYPKVSKFERFDVSHFNICCSGPQSCPTLCDPMDCSTPGFPVHHQLPFIQTHVHWVGDAVQPSHPLSSPSPPTFNLSQHQGLLSVRQQFASVGQRIGVSASASVLPMNIPDWFPLGWPALISLQSKGLSRAFSSTPVQKH